MKVISLCKTTGNQAYLQFYLSNFTDRRSLVNAIRRIHYCNENTNTTGGLRLTRTEIFKVANGDHPDVPNVIVLITDGNPTRETDILGDEVRLIKSLDITIVGVGVTNEVSDCSTTVLFSRVCAVAKDALLEANAKMGALKMLDMKLRDLNMRHKIAGLIMRDMENGHKNAAVENAGKSLYGKS